MEREARELLRIAKEIQADIDQNKQKAGLKKDFVDFLKENKQAILDDEYAFARISLHGPKTSIKWSNIYIADLEAIIKVLK